MNTRTNACVALLLSTALLAPAAISGQGADISVEPVVWIWFDGAQPAPVGTSKLVRNDHGVRATFHTDGLSAGHVMTLWFVVFNNPDACWGEPFCNAEDLILNPDAEADFLWGAGKIVGGNGSSNFGGSLSVGEIERSAFPEIGMAERAIGLTNPRRAEVHLLIHSHGPMARGQTLRSQLNSFLGGCTPPFLGNAFGAAEGFDDVPANPGECSTIQASIHTAGP